MSASLELQRLCGFLNRPHSEVGDILNLMNRISLNYQALKEELTKRDVKAIIALNLGYPEWEYRPVFIKVISRLCYIYDIQAYCRLELSYGEIAPEKNVYLIGPDVVVTLVKVILKYLMECKKLSSSIKLSENTIGALKEHFYSPLLEGLHKMYKVDMRYKPLYRRVMKNYLLKHIILPYPPTTLMDKPHWLKSVKLKNPKFKDKYLI